MTDLQNLSAARICKKHIPRHPSKPQRAPFEGFEGDQGSRFSARMRRMAGGGVCPWELAGK
jgi:hypothetical protein